MPHVSDRTQETRFVIERRRPMGQPLYVPVDLMSYHHGAEIVTMPGCTLLETHGYLQPTFDTLEQAVEAIRAIQHYNYGEGQATGFYRVVSRVTVIEAVTGMI